MEGKDRSRLVAQAGAEHSNQLALCRVSGPADLSVYAAFKAHFKDEHSGTARVAPP